MAIEEFVENEKRWLAQSKESVKFWEKAVESERKVLDELEKFLAQEKRRQRALEDCLFKDEPRVQKFGFVYFPEEEGERDEELWLVPEEKCEDCCSQDDRLEDLINMIGEGDTHLKKKEDFLTKCGCKRNYWGNLDLESMSDQGVTIEFLGWGKAKIKEDE